MRGRSYSARRSARRRARRNSAWSRRAASTSRWVTARRRVGPKRHSSTPGARALRTSAGRVGDLEDDDVGLAPSRGRARRRQPARPSARRRALAWSSARRSTWWSSAYSAAAATTPAWRSAPPSICLKRQASSISAAEPARQAPKGAPRPLVKSSQAVSKPRAPSRRDAAGDHGVHEPRPVQVRRAGRAARRCRARARSARAATRARRRGSSSARPTAGG